MELSQRVDELEAELKIVKNEVQTVLLDIRERVLSYYDNPFQVIEARSGGSKGDVDASIIGGDRGGSNAAPAPAPAVAPAAVEQQPLAPARGSEISEGAMKMDGGMQSGELKLLADQMQLERQSLELERRAMEQANQALQAGASSMVPGQFGAATPGQFGPTAPGQFGSAVPGQFGPTAPGQFGAGAQAMPGQPMMQQPMQPMMQQPMQPMMQAPQGMQGSQPMVHNHTHKRDYPEDFDEEEGGLGDTRESYTRQGGARQDRRPSSGQGTRPGRRMSAERDDSDEERGRRPARRLNAGKRRPGEGWITHTEAEEETAAEGQEVNLMTLIGLVRWVEKSIQKIGKERVEAIVEIYRTAGYLPSSYNDTIPQVIRLADDEKPEGVITMGDSISVLLQLDSLLGGKFKTESAVLSTLFGDDGGYPWTKQ